MSKTEQVLILDPPTELHFKGTFTSIVTSTLKLSNPTEQRVCFKVKTTAPKQYCVRPNSGIIEAKKSVEVAVMLQPFEYNPSEKNKHKFMVQSLFAPDGDFSQDLLWRDATPDSLMDSKLRCVFEAVSDPASNGQNTGESGNSVISSETSKNDLQTAPVKSSPKQVSGTERRKVMENEALKTENVQEVDGKESSLRQRQRTSDSGQIGSSRISKVAAGEEVIRPIQKQHQQMSQPQAASGAHHHHPTVSYPEQAGGLSQLQNPVVMAVLVLSLVLGVLVGKFFL